jgi:hypothetical protein
MAQGKGGTVDNRTRGQKAADTRKANREAEARRDALKAQKCEFIWSAKSIHGR